MDPARLRLLLLGNATITLAWDITVLGKPGHYNSGTEAAFGNVLKSRQILRHITRLVCASYGTYRSFTKSLFTDWPGTYVFTANGNATITSARGITVLGTVSKEGF